MKLKFLLILTLILNKGLFAQNHWVHFAGSTTNDASGGVALDPNGNIITTGWFSGLMTLGAQSLTTTGGTDIFLTKTNSSGQYLWAVQFGGTGDAQPNAITSDPFGNIYITGSYSGNLTAGGFNLTSNGLQDFFLIKTDIAGNVLWAYSGGGPLNDVSRAVTTDASGFVSITGNFSGSVVFGSATITSQTDPLSGFPSQDIFISRFSPAGAMLWTQQGNAPYADKGSAITTDSNGNIYVAGQFSDTLNFDLVHHNTDQNAVFLVKFNAQGVEQWFSKISGGALTTARSICSNGNNAVYLAGEVSGNALFQGPPSYIINNPYPNRVFIAKYNMNGGLAWVSADGSSSEVSAGSVCVDNTGQLSLAGTFRCKFNQYADYYGQGLFNSIGFRDIFVSRYDSSGNRLWSRQLGGQKEDEVKGIASAGANQVIISGNYFNRFIFPANSSFTYYEQAGLVTSTFNGPFCGDNEYGNFKSATSSGGSDIFWGKVIDTNRLPYDFYDRVGSSCTFDPVPGCVSLSMYENVCSGQGIPGCGGITLYANSRNSTLYGNSSPGPNYQYLWNTGLTTRNNLVNASGTYSVTVTSEDGCFSFTDSITVVINQIPSKPTITDSKGFNINSSTPTVIPLCPPDSVTLTATNMPPGATVTWMVGTSAVHVGNPFTYHAVNPGIYGVSAIYTETNGCTSRTDFFIDVGTNTIRPAIPFISINPVQSICDGEAVVGQLGDSLTGATCNIPDVLNVIWSISPYALTGIPGVCQGQSVVIYPTSPGLYQITCTLIRGTDCGINDTLLLTSTFQVSISPASNVSASVNGTAIMFLCPGDTLQLTASGGNVVWGPGGIGNTLYVTSPGNYCARIYNTNSFGCTADTTICRQVYYYSAPQISAVVAPAVICPGDSIAIRVTTQGIGYSWTGPSGPININNDTIFVSIPGDYFCHVTNSQGCTLISNTVEILEYSPPILDVSPSALFCSGDSVRLNVFSSSNAAVTWLPPLSGSGLQRYVSNSGTYSCSISSCGITTIDSVSVFSINVPAQISQTDTTICPGDSLTLIPEPFNGTAVWYPGGINANQLTTGSSGSYYMVVTDPNGCTGISNSVNIMADGVDGPQLILANTDICEGDMIYIITVLAGNYNANWTGPAGFTQTGFSDVMISDAQPNQSGYYVITLDDGICYSSPDSILINVYDSVPAYSINHTPACEGDSIFIFAQPVPGFDNIWTSPSGNSSADDNLILYPYDSSSAGWYILQVQNGACPSFEDSLFLPVPAIGSIQLPATDTIACIGDTLTLSAQSTAGTLQWQPGLTPGNTYTVTNAGQVYCILTDSTGCTFQSNSLNFKFETPPTLTVSSNSPVCEGDSLELLATIIAGSSTVYQFEWNGPGGFLSAQQSLALASITMNGAGTYIASVTDSVCGIRSDSINVNIVIAPALPVIVSNAPVCLGDTLILQANSSIGLQWIDPSGNIILQNNLVFPSLTTQDTGLYIAQAIVAGCPPSSDSIRIVPDTCTTEPIDFVMPNVFSPNADGKNDLFLPNLPEGTAGQMTILNRWGVVVFEGNLLSGWNGKGNGGEDLPESIYYYIVRPVGSNIGMWKNKTGFLELLR